MRAHRIWYTAVMIAALIIYIVADRREALILLCVLLGMPLVSAGIQLFAMRHISLACSVKPSCVVTQEVPVTFTLRRNNRSPLGPVRIEAVFENSLYRDQSSRYIDLQPCENKTMIFEYPFYAENCGSMKIKVKSMYCYEMLGLFKIKHKVDISKEVLIYPKEMKLHVSLSRRLETRNAGNMYNQDKKGQDVSEVSKLRDYVPGDELHSIHWKLSGKLDHLIVKEFGNPSNYSTLILYEMAKSCNGEKISNQCNDAVLTLAVFLSHAMMEMNLEHNVGRIIAGEFQNMPVYSIHTHEEMTLNLLCTPIEEETNEGDTVYNFMRGNRNNEYTKIIFITPIYGENAIKQLVKEADVTVIHAEQGKKSEYVKSTGYTVIPVDAERYMENVHNIVI